RTVLTWSNVCSYASLNQTRLFEKVLAELTKAIELEPKYADYHNVLAYFLATYPDPKIRDQRRAVDLARKAVELAPKAGGYWNTLGIAYYRAGEWQASLNALIKATEFDTNIHSWNSFYLSMAHWR